MNCLRKHGLIKTVLALCGLFLFAIVLILAWQLPEIILAIKA